MPEPVKSYEEVLDKMDATTGWAVLGTDTTNLATTAKHCTGTAALEFDKADGAANTIYAGIAKTISTIDLGTPGTADAIRVTFYLSAITDVAYVFVRLGTSSSHYNEWRIDDSDITAGGWGTAHVRIGESRYAGQVGDGWNPHAVSYASVGVAFDAQDDTLEDIAFDHLAYVASVRSDLSVQTEVTATIDEVSVSGQAISAANAEAFGVHLEDDAHTTGDPGVQMLGVNNGETPSSSTAGDYATLNLVSAYGDLLVKEGWSYSTYSSRATVASAGTAEAGPTQSLRNGGTVRANHTNTGLLYVGTSSVDSAEGYMLQPGESVRIEHLANANQLYFDVDVSGEGYGLYAGN